MQKLPQKLVPWAEARRRHRLSHAHVQMARELGLNPKKLGKLDNCDQQPWKAPLPEFICRIYFKRFGRERPETVFSLEEIAARQKAKKVERRAQRSTRPDECENNGKPAPAGLQDAEVEEGRDRVVPDDAEGPPWF